MFEVKKTQSSQEHLPGSVWDHLCRLDWGASNTATNPFPHPSLMSTEATHKPTSELHLEEHRGWWAA